MPKRTGGASLDVERFSDGGDLPGAYAQAGYVREFAAL
jgi:hypothetical protein